MSINNPRMWEHDPNREFGKWYKESSNKARTDRVEKVLDPKPIKQKEPRSQEPTDEKELDKILKENVGYEKGKGVKKVYASRMREQMLGKLEKFGRLTISIEKIKNGNTIEKIEGNISGHSVIIKKETTTTTKKEPHKFEETKETFSGSIDGITLEPNEAKSIYDKYRFEAYSSDTDESLIEDIEEEEELKNIQKAD